MKSSREQFINWEEEIQWYREKQYIDYEEEKEYQQLKIELAPEMRTWQQQPKVWTIKVPHFIKKRQVRK